MYDIIIQSIIALVSAVLTIIIIPYIKTKITKDQREEIEAWIKIAVAAAEQAFKGLDKKGAEKKEYVKLWLVENGYVNNIDAITSNFDALIEAAVYELKK